ncbi:MAG: AMP-binding protein, partial [Ilumatobacteraceae bacterium]
MKDSSRLVYPHVSVCTLSDDRHGATPTTQGGNMKGLMQPTQLTLVHLFERAERYSRDKKIITASASGKVTTTYGEWADRARLLGGVLDNLKISKHGRVATLAWNSARHLELYFAAPCSSR